MRKKLITMCAVALMAVAVCVPAHAVNSDLDVKMNDIYSYPTYKDDNETNFYVNASLFTGTYIRARSKCVTNSNYQSGYMEISKRLNTSIGYGYGLNYVPAGVNYTLDAYGAPGNTWHLVGKYCP